MSQENVEIVRSIYEAFNRRDWDAAFRDQRSDVELMTPPGPQGGTYRGREECQASWEEMISAFAAAAAERAFRDGTAASIQVFPEPKKALEAAGLRE